MRTFKKLLVLAGLLLLALPAVGDPVETQVLTLLVSYDLDGEAADPDQIVGPADVLADSTTYVIDAQPDVCRLVDITIADTLPAGGITAGTITVTGTDCWGDPLIAVFSGFTAGDDDGVKSLTVTTGKASAAYFKTVASVVTGLLTGETGAETLAVGYTSNSQAGYGMYGWRLDRGNQRLVDLGKTREVPILVKNNASTTALQAVTLLTGPFTNVAVGDLLYFNLSGVVYRTKVTIRTDADNINIETPITLPTAGARFSFKRFYISTDPYDGWITMSGFKAATFIFDVRANVSTGGVVSNVDCRASDFDQFPQFQVDTATVATTTTGSDTTTIAFDLAAYPYCRLGLKFGTGDDTDTAVENIYANLLATR